MNITPFHKVEVDTDKIKDFVRERFEKELGKDNVLNTQLFSYPNEFTVRVTVRKKTPEVLDISHNLRDFFIENDLHVILSTIEAQDENEKTQKFPT